MRLLTDNTVLYSLVLLCWLMTILKAMGEIDVPWPVVVAPIVVPAALVVLWLVCDLANLSRR